MKLILTIIFCGATHFLFGQKNNVSIGRGTCILTLITNDSIVLIADTREFVDSNHTYFVSKIKRVDNIYHAESGLGTLRDTVNNKLLLNIKDTISSVIKECKSFNKITEAIRIRLLNTLPTIRANSRGKSISKLFSPHFIKVSIVTFNHKNPKYIFGIFNVIGKSWDKLRIEFVPDSISNSHFFLNENGYTDQIDSLSKVDKPFFYTISNKKLIYLIKLEAKKNPYVVHCPFEILTIKPDTNPILKKITCD